VSTVVLVHRDGSVLFVERDRWVLSQSFPQDGVDGDDGERRFRFTIAPEPEGG
jgi:hypothetical protein